MVRRAQRARVGLRGLRARLTSDAGAGGVLALAIVAATLVCALAVAALGSALVVRQRLVAAADAAALAAADTLLGVVPGDPCTRARELAEAHRVGLEVCTVAGAEARITVGSSVLGLPVSAEARAGPAP
jgi:secretion/DNA translocation related TadE-like protein